MVKSPVKRKIKADPIVLFVLAGTFMFWVLVIALVARPR